MNYSGKGTPLPFLYDTPGKSRPMTLVRPFPALLAFLLALSLHGTLPAAEDAPKPLKALLVTGGCCHDYDTQKNIIKKGLEARARIEVTVVHQGGSTTDTKIPLYEDPNWADGYDIVLHDECFAGVKDPTWTARVLAPHRKGVPGVVIHCAMHCYRDGTDQWFEFCGVTSHGHGAHYPHAVYNYDAEHPIMDGFGAAWANPQGELYHIAKVWPTAHILGASKERDKGTEHACAWTNQYKNTRVFGTTLGHHNETVSDDTFLDLLTRGTLWACDKLNDDYLLPQSEEPTLVPVNLALNKPATASSEETGKNNLAPHAVDGKSATRWCANSPAYPQWLQVDLGEPKELRGCQLEWESNHNQYRYTIEGSADGEKWMTLVDRTENLAGPHDFQFKTDGIRYIRVSAKGNPTGGWASIRELRVFGTEMETLDPVASKDAAEQEKLSEVKAPEGFDVTLFAAPPAVNYPVFVAASPEGDVYVAVDKNGSLDREPMRGAVHRLRDTDGDGRADEVKLFVPNVDSPRGMVWDRDRLYVLHPPHLSAFIDEDGDGRSDRQEILVKNLAFTFKDRPADHTSNGVTLGIDGWLYLAIGDFGFMEAEGTDGRKLQMRGGGVLRVRPDGTNMEIYSEGTRNILEVAMDPLLNGFTRDNTNDGGGWDIRLHHFSGLEDHGYPRLYMNFGEEIVQPLADYGGGSGCGALYMDEPGFPEGYGNALYTADWGRSWIYRHNPKRKGATFEVNQEEFLGIPRVTDLDVDANSHIYAASWKGATFKYAGEDVGYLVRVSPKGYEAKPLPNLREADTDTLLELLESDSHRRRLAAQRELLARGLDDATIKRIVRKEPASPEAYTATLYLLIQDAIKRKLTGDDLGFVALYAERMTPETEPITIRATADYEVELRNGLGPEILRLNLRSENRRSQLESIIALARIGSPHPDLTSFLGNSDPTLRHTAFRALAKLEAIDPLFFVIDGRTASETKRQYALFALQRIHKPEVVEGLIDRLAKEESFYRRQGLLTALCRLYHIEGEWKGNSWGTRPDTRGPYYQPEKWEQSDRLGKVLRQTLAAASTEESKFLLGELRRHRVDLDGTLRLALQKAGQDPTFAAAAVQYVADSDELPAEAVGLLKQAATDAATAGNVRSQAVTALLRGTEADIVEAALVGLDRLYKTGPKTPHYLSAYGAFQKPESLSRQVPVFEKFVGRGDTSAAVWAEAALVLLSKQEKLSPEVQSTVKSSLEVGWKSPVRQPQLLQAALITNDRQLEPQVVPLLSSRQADVAAAASKVAEAWQLKTSMPKPQGPKVGTLDPQEVVKQVVGMQGDASRGEQLYAKLQCNKCHTVDPNEPPRGPYLPQVAKTYKRDQLAEAVVLPSKSLAQGFVTNIFQMEDGRVLSGFITFEGPDEIVIRDNQGNEIKLNPNEIEGQRKDDVSVMPVGLANDVTVGELADLVSYLESLSAKAQK